MKIPKIYFTGFNGFGQFQNDEIEATDEVTGKCTVLFPIFGGITVLMNVLAMLGNTYTIYIKIKL